MPIDRRTFFRRSTAGVAAALGGSTIALIGDRATETNLNPFTTNLLNKVPKSSISMHRSTGSAGVWWSANITAKQFALTFDDGPTPEFTPKLLELLAQTKARATFFVIGELVNQRPDLLLKIKSAGHEIANHSFDHRPADQATSEEISSSISAGTARIAAVTGQPPRWYRPPCGVITSATMLSLAKSRQDCALWSVTRGPSPDADLAGVRQHLDQALHPGAIVLLHDGIGASGISGAPDSSLLTRRRTELAALEWALPRWLAQGWQPRTLSELIPAQLNTATRTSN